MNNNSILNELTGRIIGCAMKVHTKLGFGFLESVYANSLAHELGKAGLKVEKELRIKVYYDGVVVGDFIADLMVEDRIVVELKAVQTLIAIHEVQLVNYLKATGKQDGLLFNFGTSSLEFKRKFRTPRQD